MKVFLFALCCVVAYGATISKDQSEESEDFVLPEYVKTCYEDDPNLNQCVREAISDMMPRLNNGLKSLSIPALDPYTVDRAQVAYGNGPVQGAVKVKNVQTFGMSQIEFRDVRMTLGKDGTVKTEIDMHMPRIYMEGAYKADIKFNDLKLHPKGRFNVTMTNVDMTQKYAGHLIEKKGHKYLQVEDFDVIPEIEDMKINVDGIFSDPAMNTLAVNFLNQYWPVIYKMLLPETRDYWQPMMINAINEFLQSVPFDLLVKKRD